MTWFGAVVSGRCDRAWATLLGLALVLAGGGACTTNHDALARQPGAGGSNGGSAGAGGGGFGNTGDVPSGGRVNPDVEPEGDDVLTIVNGVVDAESVVLCLARVDEGNEIGELVGSPLIELPYAGAKVFTELDGFSFADDAVAVWAIAGDLSLISGMDCNDAVALALEEEARVTPPDVAEPMGSGGQGGGGDGGTGGQGAVAGEGGAFAQGVAGEGGALAQGLAGEGGAAGGANAPAPAPQPPLEMPALRARPLGAIPAGTVNIGRSILMVLTGCLGGAYYTDPNVTSVCGGDYTPSTPTAQAVVVKLSREIGFDKVGLQAVHAALAVPGTVDVRASSEDGVSPLTFANDVAFGGVEPRPADVRFTPTDLGADRGDFGLQAADRKGVIFEEAWSDVFASSSFGSLEPLRTYTAILIGPHPLLDRRGWWNSSAFALIDNDPTRE